MYIEPMRKGRGFLVPGACLLACLLAPGLRAAEKTYSPDLSTCAGFTAKDAAPFLGVAPERVVVKAAKVHAALWTCDFSVGAAGKSVAFSIEVEKTPQAAAAAMERYRADLEVAADTAPFKGKLPKGAWSEIVGDGFGDENVWTDVNGAFTARKGNVTVQLTQPAGKLEQLAVARALLAKF